MMNGQLVPSNNATYRSGNQKPRIMKERENDPKVYGFICPGCEIRYGEPQAGGYVDVTRCGDCYKELNVQDEKKREKESTRARANYWKKKIDLKQKRSQAVF
jgi:hypothetical protein